MTSRERLEKALNFEETDRIPCDIGATTVSSFTQIAFENAMKAKGIDPVFDDMEDYDPIQQIIQPDHTIREELGIDTHRVGAPRLAGPEMTPVHEENGVYKLTDQFGCDWDFDPSKDFYYNIQSAPLKQYETVKEGFQHYKMPNMADAEEEVRKVFDEQASKMVSQGVVADRNSAGLTEVAFRIRGYEEFFMDMALDPEGASLLMEKILEYKLDYWSFFGKYARETGLIDHILVASECDDLGTQESLLFSPDMIRERILPPPERTFSTYEKRTSRSQGDVSLRRSCIRPDPRLDRYGCGYPESRTVHSKRNGA